MANDIHIDPKTIGDWISDAKNMIGLVKDASYFLPKGKPKEKVDAAIVEAEVSLDASAIQLAKLLGYKLCYCTKPPTPTVMLWREADQADVCGTCGHKEFRGPRPMKISKEALDGI